MIAMLSGRAAVSAIVAPSRSSVSVAMPQRMRKRYRFRPAAANCTVLVASPSASGRIPVASGSSVPACPVLAPVLRLTIATTRAEVRPAGLSMISQPCSAASARRVIALRIWLQIALDLGGVEERRDPRRVIDGIVEGKDDVRDLAQLFLSRHP